MTLLKSSLQMLFVFALVGYITSFGHLYIFKLIFPYLSTFCISYLTLGYFIGDENMNIFARDDIDYSKKYVSL